MPPIDLLFVILVMAVWYGWHIHEYLDAKDNER